MNSADNNPSVNDNNDECLAVVTNSGIVTYIPPKLFKSICIINIDEFPFDEQKCKLVFLR